MVLCKILFYIPPWPQFLRGHFFIFGSSCSTTDLRGEVWTAYLSVIWSKTESAKARWLIQVWSLYRDLCSGCDRAVADIKSINPMQFIVLNSSTVTYPWRKKYFRTNAVEHLYNGTFGV